MGIDRRRPHVAFVVANYSPHVGGVERHVEHLAAHMRSAGILATVFTLEEPGERVANGVPVVGLGRQLQVADVAALPNGQRGLGLPEMLRERSISHVSVHTRFFPTTWLGLWAGHKLGLPVLLTEHGGGHATAGGRTLRAASRAVDRTFGRAALRHADAVLAVSDRSAEFVRALSGRESIVCGNGIDPAWWAPEGQIQDSDQLVFVGRIVPEKGWREFLVIVAGLPGSPAAVFGDGPEMGQLLSAVHQMGLGDRVRIRGQAAPTELRDELRGSVYVNPSRAAEGLQTTLLEAAAAGARIATYEVGGSAEVAGTGAAIWTAPSGDLGNLKVATQHALAGQWRPPTRMDRYSWGRVLNVYESVIEGFR